MKKIILTLFILFTLAGCNRQEWLGARTSDFWKTVGNNLRPIDDNYNVQIPSLSNCNTIDTDAWGKLVCGTDEVGGGGGGGSGLWATTTDNKIIHPANNNYIVTIGSQATTTPNSKLEVYNSTSYDNVFKTGINQGVNLLLLEAVGWGGEITLDGGNNEFKLGYLYDNTFYPSIIIPQGQNGDAIIDGKLSVGTSSLIRALTVESGTTNNAVRLHSTDPGIFIEFFDDSTANAPLVGGVGDELKLYGGGTLGLTIDSSGNIQVNTITSGTWQGSSITDAYIDDNITASNYLSLTDWYSTTTDALSEGTGNLYWTQARFDSAFSGKSTDDLSEGIINLYYTNSRVDSHLSGGTGITYSSGNINFDCSEVEGTGINCSGENITLDNTGDWTGTLDGYEGSAFVLRNDWTTIDNYPTGCSAGEYVQAIGDTLTCATDQDTTYTAGGTLLQLSGTQFSLKEGTLTDGKLCRYDTTDGLVCDYTDQTGDGGGGSGTVESGTAGQIAYYKTSTSTVSGTSTIFITPGQKVGIGTTAPGLYDLKVSGQYGLFGATYVYAANLKITDYGGIGALGTADLGEATRLYIPVQEPGHSFLPKELAIWASSTEPTRYNGFEPQLIYQPKYEGAASYPYTLNYYREKCFTIASTTFNSYDNIPVWYPHKAVLIIQQYCRVDGGTSVVVTCGDGTNNMDSITCTTSGANDDYPIINNTFNEHERFECSFGTITGNANWLTYCITYAIDQQP